MRAKIPAGFQAVHPLAYLATIPVTMQKSFIAMAPGGKQVG